MESKNSSNFLFYRILFTRTGERNHGWRSSPEGNQEEQQPKRAIRSARKC
jgi:hypothetical protein